METKVNDWRSLRNIMITSQLKRRGIKDKRVLDAFNDVPRHEFIPAQFQSRAYDDSPVPLGYGQTISQPYMVARMTELMSLTGTETVLEVGSGSGYQAAILGRLCKKVFSVERIPELCNYAEQNVIRCGVTNVQFINTDGTKGYLEHAPYDGIVVTAGSPQIPHSLVSQLRDTGRLVIPVGNEYSQILTVVRKKGDTSIIDEYFACVFVPLIGEEGWNK